MAEKFQDRLSQAFEFATMAEVARRIGVPHATIRNYFLGRLPSPEVLIKIANETHVSLNWLLSGTGEMYLAGREPLDLDKLIDRRIAEIVDRKLNERSGETIQNLGIVDEAPAFDVERAVKKHRDPQRVMSEWFLYEGRDYPQDFGVVFFQGWETYTPEEKVEAVKDAKRVLDRALKRGLA